MNIIIGFLSGLAASMGLGGGFVLLVYLTGFTDCGQLEAQGVNLLFFLPIALLSLIIHTRNKLVEWRLIPIMAGVGVVGVAVGVILAGVLDEGILRKLFSGLLILVAIKEIFHKKPSIDKND